MADLIFLTQGEFAVRIASVFRSAAPAVTLAVAETLPELEAALRGGPQSARVIAFGSGVIVPERVLERLPGPAYNFHPGPPAYRGIYPSVFALYDGAREFGVTLHEIAPEIDRGAIVAVDRFAVDPAWDRLALDTAAFTGLLRMLERLAVRLADPAIPLTHITEEWSVPRHTRKEFESLCRLPENATAEEFARRYRAVGEGPEHALTIDRFGRTFRLEGNKGGDVVRGGQPVKP